MSSPDATIVSALGHFKYRGVSFLSPPLPIPTSGGDVVPELWNQRSLDSYERACSRMIDSWLDYELAKDGIPVVGHYPKLEQPKPDVNGLFDKNSMIKHGMLIWQNHIDHAAMQRTRKQL